MCESYEPCRTKGRSRTALAQSSASGLRTITCMAKQRKALKKRYCKKNAKLNKRSTNYKYYRRKMASYIGWFKHANCYSLLNKTIKHKELLDYLDIRKGNKTYE